MLGARLRGEPVPAEKRLSNIWSDLPRDRSYAERQAVNHGVRATAADIAKPALVRVHRVLRDVYAALGLQIHGELVIECLEDEVNDTIPLIKTAMEGRTADGPRSVV